MDLDAVEHQVRREPVRAPYKIALRQRALERYYYWFRERHGVRRRGDPAEGVARQRARRVDWRRGADWSQGVRERGVGTNAPPTPLLSA